MGIEASLEMKSKRFLQSSLTEQLTNSNTDNM